MNALIGMEMNNWVTYLKQRMVARSPEGLLVESFGLLILAGTFLLWLPWAHRPGAVGFVDALFTATSSVCVTGLNVVDTGTDYTMFGQLVILMLIQLGGLGVMTFATIAFDLLGRRLSLKAQMAVQETLWQQDMAIDFKTVFWRILKLVLVIEAMGTAVLFVGFQRTMGLGTALYSAIFHAISSFCNAGFSIYPDSLIGQHSNPVVMPAIMLLIVLGGIGHPVLIEIWRLVWPKWRKQRSSVRRFSLHARLVLWTSAILIMGGALAFMLFGLGPQQEGWFPYLANALFQSITARTAGFNAVDMEAIPLASLMIMIVLMFIGGSPASCAGGIKTTTFAIWVGKVWYQLRGEKTPRVFERHIAGEITRRVSMIIGLAVVWNLVGFTILLHTENGAGMHDVVFEQISAFGTVGLSTGLTPKLSIIGRFWIIATMFMGRLGPLTLAMAMFERRTPGVRYPSGKVMIG
jgi:trk system potassium uptake protein TrkH